MDTEHTILRARERVRQWQLQGLRVGFVPTMGNLHAGHLSLVDTARQHCDKVVVSIFVNPLQFGPNEDFASYPRTLDADTAALQSSGVDLVFAPSVQEMYPQGREGQTQVSVPAMGEELEGQSRPGFFTGVATVVSKLFHIVPADVAVFGQKDYQQLLVIRQMVADLNIPMEIIAAPIVREANGLAMSSRNGYLDAAQREQATALYQGLQQLEEQLGKGRRDFTALEAECREFLQQQGLRADYVSIRNSDDLQAAREGDGRCVILAAAWLDTTRLIDNISVNLQ